MSIAPMPMSMMQSKQQQDFLGWMSRQGEEIGDNPISATHGVLKKYFRK